MEIKKPLDTIDLALSAVGLIKSAALIFGVVLIEWARSRQRLAENRQAVAETDLAVAQAKGAVDAEQRGKTSDSIIAEYLSSGGEGPSK